jgi:predicted nucleotidyltransferase
VRDGERVDKKLEKILKELRERLFDVYGKRLKKVILYGSWARREATEDSDIDISIVLEGEVRPGREIDRINDVICEIELKYDVLISVYPVSIDRFQNLNSPLLINIKKEGIVL